jgi:hypothetical protein
LISKKIIIGIDPDTDKSGVAALLIGTKQLELETMKFFDLFKYLALHKDNIKEVVVEAGWLNKKSNFHINPRQTKEAGERISKNVGANHETGRKIVEMCDFIKIPFRLYVPRSAKTTPEYFEKLTGIKTRNQEKIDAAMLVLGS